MGTTVKIDPNAGKMREIEAHISQGKRVLVPVGSGSMSPFLRPNDRVELAAVDIADLHRGDVVLFRHRENDMVRHILHRIRRIDGNRLEIRGDHNYRRVETAVRGDIAARVTAIRRGEKIVATGSRRWRNRTAISLTINWLLHRWWGTKRVIKTVIKF